MTNFILPKTLLSILTAVVGCGLLGLVLGFVVDRVVLPRMQRMASRTKWQGDDILFSALRRYVAVWGALAGLYVGVSLAALSPSLSTGLYKALAVLMILTVTMAAAKAASGFAMLYARNSIGSESSLSIFRNVTKIAVYAVGLLMILQHLGVSITPVLTALGVGGLAVALALQGTLSNLFAGIQLLASKKIKPGDYIQLDTGQEGYVTDVTWRETTMRALPNNLIIVPNAKLAAALVTNFYRPEKDLAILVQVGVSYDSDLAHVERVTIDVASDVMQNVNGGVPDFEPFIRYHTFADFSINFTVILRGKEYTDQYLVKHEFVKRLHQRYAQEGIEIPFPIRTIHVAPRGRAASDGESAETTI
jgi:small-conductance mechanosensitive channel